jgi:adenine/guanine phosphoribosyltransferase-like PRPP-binding protein
LSIALTDDVVERGATIVKALRLIDSPGMDEVAVKLNMVPTSDELQSARDWAEAFERAALDKNIRAFDHAMEMRRARRK